MGSAQSLHADDDDDEQNVQQDFDEYDTADQLCNMLGSKQAGPHVSPTSVKLREACRRRQHIENKKARKATTLMMMTKTTKENMQGAKGGKMKE